MSDTKKKQTKKAVTPKKSKKKLSPTSMEYWEQDKQLEQITEWVSNGLPMKDIAKNMGISNSTLYNWRDKSVEILDSLHAGREVKLQKVEHAMFMRAVGYDKEEIHYKYDEDGNRTPIKSRIVHYPGEASLIKYFANNVDPKNWQDKVTYEDTTAHEKLDELLEAQRTRLKEDK